MQKLKSKFDKLFEDTIYRFQSGGVMNGDIVKFRKDALNNEKIKGMMENYQAQIRNAMETDLNLRVSAVKSVRPATTQNYSGVGTDAPADHYVDIVVEYAPGLWRDPITVPIEVLERVDTGINMAPVPDSLKKDDPTTNSSEVVTNDADRSNPRQNTTIPAPKPKDGRSQLQSLEKVYENMYNDPTLIEEKKAKTIKENIGDFKKFKLDFSYPYGEEPRDRHAPEMLKRNLIGLFGHNISIDWMDDNSMEIIVQKNINSKQFENVLAPLINGTVSIEEIPMNAAISDQPVIPTV